MTVTPTPLDSTSQGNLYAQFGGFQEFKEKLSSIKQLSHAWQLSGNGFIHHVSIPLEGTVTVDFRSTFQKSLKSFSNTNICKIDPKAIEHLSTLLEGRDNSKSFFKLLEEDSKKAIESVTKQNVDLLFEDFQKEQPVSISTGFKGHRVVVSFDGDYLLVANKGSVTQRPIEVYKIDREKVTKDQFQEIVNLIEGTEFAYIKWHVNIYKAFHAKKDAFCLCIEQAYPLSSYQKVGNCVWESLQTCVYGSLLLNQLKERFSLLKTNEKKNLIDTVNKTFLCWREFLQLQSLERYFRSYTTSTETQKPANDGIPFEELDKNILRKVLRRFWSTQPSSLEFEQKMNRLESLYFHMLSEFELRCAKLEKLCYTPIRKVPYVISDLATVWAPSAIATAIFGGLSQILPSERVRSIVPALVPFYLHSLSYTTHLARRHFAI